MCHWHDRCLQQQRYARSAAICNGYSVAVTSNDGGNALLEAVDVSSAKRGREAYKLGFLVVFSERGLGM
jgi:hypothetical protein